jgi:hypothetical protein
MSERGDFHTNSSIGLLADVIMSNLLDPNQGQELRDASSLPLGRFFPSLFVQELTAERDRLRAEAARLQQEVERLRSELAAVTAEKAEITVERDDYREALSDLVGFDCHFSRREILEAEKEGMEFSQVIAEIEDEFKQARGDAQ